MSNFSQDVAAAQVFPTGWYKWYAVERGEAPGPAHIFVHEKTVKIEDEDVSRIHKSYRVVRRVCDNQKFAAANVGPHMGRIPCQDCLKAGVILTKGSI